MGNKNFDQELLLRQGRETYLANKSKAGMSSSTAGRPRPYAKQNMLKARLWSPLLVGQTLTVTPKHPYLKFGPGCYYEWKVTEVGSGIIESTEISAEEISEHFIVKPKGLK